MSDELNLKPDPYDAWGRVHRLNSVLLWVSGVLFFMFCASMSINYLLVMRKISVAMPTCNGEPTRVITAGQQEPVTQAYARSFFVRMLRKRFGWSSLTVTDELESYLRHCYRPLREREEASFQEMLTPDSNRPSEKVSRLAGYIRANVRNDVVFPSIDQVECRRKEDMLWHCRSTFTIVTQMLLPPFTMSPVQDILTVRATMAEIPFTTELLDGLMLMELAEIKNKAT